MHASQLETAWQKACTSAQAKADFLRELCQGTVLVILYRPPGPGAAEPERNLVHWQRQRGGESFVPIFTDTAHLTTPVPPPAQAVRVATRVLLRSGGNQRRYVVNPLSATPIDLDPSLVAQMRTFIEAQGYEAAEPSRDAPWAFQLPEEALYPVAVALVTWFNANGRVDSAYMYELTRGGTPPIVVLGLDLPVDPELAETLKSVAVAAGVDPGAFVVRFLPDEPSHCAGIAGIGLTPFYRRP
ncbi:SseB family protein [Dyella sp. 20L07]|uniref:SseB family protein n=1 Tax=Dyella sp. 20L07 TaxID=3384240 RepID=UPI003D2C2E86